MISLKTVSEKKNNNIVLKSEDHENINSRNNSNNNNTFGISCQRKKCEKIRQHLIY